MATAHFQVKALYEYSSPHDDDLSFPNGQVITVTDEEEADWYYGEYHDTTGAKHEGLFPRNFVKMYEPEPPPRPSRSSRSKRDVEPSGGTMDADKTDRSMPTELLPEQSVPDQQSKGGSINTHESHTNIPFQITQASRAADIPSSIPPMNLATKPTLSNSTKPSTPPVTEKPVTGSFRDRINAFNKPAAAPVAPLKPSGLASSGGSSFVKKPFVAPPPSKNAYVAPPREPPPQKIYRREEDPELTAQASNITEGNELAEPYPNIEPIEDEDIPKPTTLKDRIALLQKQQMEQAARHAEAGQKKEKPRRPPKRSVELQENSSEQGGLNESENLRRADHADVSEKHSIELSRDDSLTGSRSTTRPYKSRDATPLASPTAAAPVRDFQSDANDADQSGAGDTEEGDELSGGRDDSDEKPRNKAFNLPARVPVLAGHREDDENSEDNANDDEQEEEDEIDPEVKRRMEIRERMAKMSGGMGMAGMFGPAGGVSPMASKKQGSASSDRKASLNSVSVASDSSASRAPPIPMMPMPGMQRVRTPEQEDVPIDAHAEEADDLPPIPISEHLGDIPNTDDLSQQPLPPSRRSTERAIPPPVPQDRAQPPFNPREAPPSPLDRPVPSPRVDSRLLPPIPSQIMSPSEGSESDDEMSLRAGNSSLKIPENEDSRPTSREGPSSTGPPLSLPIRPQGPQSRASAHGPSSPHTGSQEISPSSLIATSNLAKRPGRVPPIPASTSASPAVPFAPQTRAPPPPRPVGVPSSRVSTGDSKRLSDTQRSPIHQYSDEEVTEYEGDYDTDMAPGATRKEALKSHARTSSLDDELMSDEVTYHHSGFPSLGPPMSAAPRAIPPPPPSQPPKSLRQSSEMPRAPPPPPPPAKEQNFDLQQDDVHDQSPDVYNNDKSSGPQSNGFGDSATPIDDDPDNLYPASPPRRNMPPLPSPGIPQYESPSTLSTMGRPAPRQSLDVQRTSTSNRRSMDAPRQSSEQGFIAGDIDVGQDSMWWAQPNTIPPILQNRRDLIYEMEETSTTGRGGKHVMTRTLYILYMDYSQTVVSAQFETKNPVAVSLKQDHEPPPPRLRQDQLEDAHSRFGSTIGENASSKKDNTVGDGTPQALVLELLTSLSDALLPVGIRAYGALVYANLANATVQQFDEIRSGDIVTFRNSRFQGHRGPMKSKYSIDVGKPDHVGIVVDWDGTKKKIRAWEQGREGKKVRIESFKLSDMRSGEVKVWRVMARSWVHWEEQK